jgi:hypothetical protein
MQQLVWQTVSLRGYVNGYGLVHGAARCVAAGAAECKYVGWLTYGLSLDQGSLISVLWRYI